MCRTQQLLLNTAVSQFAVFLIVKVAHLRSKRQLAPLLPAIAHICSAEQELMLQQVVLVVAAIHAFEAVIAVVLAKSKGVDQGGQLAAIAFRVSSVTACSVFFF